MRTIRTVAEMRAWLGNARDRNRSVGLVPTMGAFHAGHHSLMRAARDEMDEVVVSLFVNPAQFNDAKDLQSYRAARPTTRSKRVSSGSTCCSRPRPARSTPRASRRP